RCPLVTGVQTCALPISELAHGIYRADSPERAQQRGQFVDELKAHIPVHPVTEATAEIIATRWWRAGGPTVFAATEFEYDYPYRKIGRAAWRVRRHDMLA